MTRNVFERKDLVIKICRREFHLTNLVDMNIKSKVIICEYGLKNAIVYWYAFISKPKFFAFWGHGDTYTIKKSRIEKKMKDLLLKRVDFFLAYTKSCSNMLIKKGFHSKNIEIVYNSIDTSAIIQRINFFNLNNLFSFVFNISK